MPNEHLSVGFDTMLSVFTLEQQRIYLRNIAIQYWVEASDTDLTDG